MQTQISSLRYVDSTHHNQVGESSVTTGNIAVVLQEGFSLLELGLVAEVFQQANQALASTRPRANRFSVTLLSARGGYVMDASSVRIRTDALDERLFERFDGVFVIGGSGARTACDDPVVINALRKLLSNSNIVKWNDAGRRLVAATGHASAMSTADVKIGDFESRQYTSSPRRGVPVLGHDVDSLLAAALSLVTGDLGTQIARRINRRVASPTVGAPESDGEDANEVNAPDRIHRAAHWLRENCRRSISVAQAAEIAGMSERNFLRRFKLETAMTPSEFLLKARFEMSCRFLRETNLPVDKIARRCGMGSGERLSRVFRRRLAQTPTEYRAAHGSGAGSA